MSRPSPVRDVRSAIGQIQLMHQAWVSDPALVQLHGTVIVGGDLERLRGWRVSLIVETGALTDAIDALPAATCARTRAEFAVELQRIATHVIGAIDDVIERVAAAEARVCQ